MDNNTKNLITVRHGSHLYGLNTADSDIDLYTVYDFKHKNYRPNKQIEQSINDETDHVKISLDKYIEHLKKGVPQAIEVLFAHKDQWLDYDPEWEYVAGSLELLLDTEVVLETYKRTIINFFNEDNFKKNRHGFRLLLNANELKRTYRFDPTLTPYQIQIINELAEYPWEKRVNKYKDMLWDVFK